ncbi:MAG: 50S ribosomal protein L10 [Dehalococcoidia bacterium]
MPTAKKEADVAELQEMVGRSMVAISTSYRGLSVAEMTALRRRMREAGVDIRVVKNTLMRIAAERAGKPDLVQIIEGPTAVIFGYDDISKPAKAITEYVRTARNALTITGAFLDGQVMKAAEVTDLANLPSRESMIAQFVGSLQSPIAIFSGLITSVVREFAGLIDARAQQLEGEGAAA